MPNKSNPDVIEIIRANYSILAGLSSELENLLSDGSKRARVQAQKVLKRVRSRIGF